MITFEEALKIVLDNAPQCGTEKVRLENSMGRFLVEDVTSDVEMPPFDKSAMDGFACRHEDQDKELEIIETIAAGNPPKKKVMEGQCARIMTGAMVPKGANVVVKVEDTEISREGKVRILKPTTKSNIAMKAEDVQVGDVAVTSGIRIEPQHIAVMASVGWTNPLVARKPAVGVISTGDEIVESHHKPNVSQIRNSNGPQLTAQADRAGANATYFGIARDDEKLTYDLLSKALDESDVVLLSGGVSMGEYDFIPGVLEKLGIELKFKTVAIQPGKPTVFGLKNDKRIFGLPGNPVSSFTTFELFVRPMLNKMMGSKEPYRKLKMPLEVDYTRKKASRMSWIPVQFTEEGTVIPLEYHGSAHIYALAGAHAMAAVPSGTRLLKKGEKVDVRQV